MKSTSNRRAIKFGQFKLDLSEERLFKKDLPVHLENRPLQILAVLLEHPDEIVSREELSTCLWPDGTYVEFDEGLNTAIKKLRYALGDSPDNPVFIETVPRRGYRFIAPVKNDHEDGEPLQPVFPHIVGHSPTPNPAPKSLDMPPGFSRRWSAALIGLGLLVITACWLFYREVFTPALRVPQIVRVTNSGRLDPWGGLVSDGSRVFFLERGGDHWNTRQISVAGGESMPFGSSGRNTKIFAVSRNQSDVLFAPFIMRGSDLPLWSMPLVGGSPTPVGAILAGSATFSPDGSRIAFTNSNGVFLSYRDGSHQLKLASIKGWGIDWSPDGKLLRFSAAGPVSGSHLLQIDSTGHNLRPFLPSWNASDGRWTFDGSYYVFNSQGFLWAVRESSRLPWLHRAPTQLTFPPIAYSCALPSRDGQFLYACGGMSEAIDSVQFYPASHTFKPVLPAVHVSEALASPDGKWMLYSNWRQLWRSRPDGSDRVQLFGALSGFINVSVRWSPDSKRILFESSNDENMSSIFLMSADGGTPQQLVPGESSARWPDWLPNGHSISYSVERGTGRSAPTGIYLLNLDDGRSTLIDGSAGFTQGRWSPNGHFLAAVSDDTSVIRLLDLRTQRWSDVARGTLFSFPVWSTDSVLYFQDLLAPGEPVYRFQPGGAKPQREFSFEDLLQAGTIRCAFWGFAPDGSLLVQVNRGGADIYALTVKH